MPVQWYSNPPPKIMWTLVFTLFPSISVLMFVFSAYVLPIVFGEGIKWWIVVFVTLGPLGMMAWAVFVGLLQPKRIRLEPEALVWETGFKRMKSIPKERILRLEPLQDRRHGIAMCFYLDEKGREKWTGVTVEIERAILAWLVGPGT